MRPYASFGQFFLLHSSEDHGLPPGEPVVYNSRQNLPLPVCPEEGGSDKSPTPEGAMKPSRPDKTSVPDATSTAGDAGNPRETRAERLARIKREIEAGTYETPDKLEAAVERMLGVLSD